MNSATDNFVDIALPVPLRQLYTYRYSLSGEPMIGGRVRVPFGRRKLVGVIASYSEIAPGSIKCKEVMEALDTQAILSKSMLKLLLWASRYYQHPVGEVVFTALPKKLREGAQLDKPQQFIYTVNPNIKLPTFSRAPVQQRIVELVQQRQRVTEYEIGEAVRHYRAPLKALLDKGIFSRTTETINPDASSVKVENAISLNAEQTLAYKTISNSFGEYACFLLNGVTGSGKTEVYFSLIDQCISDGKQTLVLFPEIALTTQLQQRFVARFGDPNVVSLHSGLSEKQRGQAWLIASRGEAPIVLGTRMAVFTTIGKLGLIIVDEEHDSSFKQQQGFRYHARSIAIKRARDMDIPVLLGSATPSLESLQNVYSDRYIELKLTKRAATENLPQIQFVDLNHFPSEDGLTQPVRMALEENYKQGKQSMVFINRRGFAPILYCNACHWVASCSRCDASLTQHLRNRNLSCHFCGASVPTPTTCARCQQPTLAPLGDGTQRIEQVLGEALPEARITRFDRDVMASQSTLEQGLQSVHTGDTDILVGTQLLTKGHDFKEVKLVVVINADQGLHSHDFRATERLTAQLIQVAGRAGRSSSGGRVLIQTHHVNNPTLLAVQSHDYMRFAKTALQERKLANFPPFGHLAIWRAQSPQQGKALYLLQQLAKMGGRTQTADGFMFDPCKSAMEKKAGRYRAQLLVSSASRRGLNQWLSQWIGEFEKTKLSRLARWSIDVDPIDLY